MKSIVVAALVMVLALDSPARIRLVPEEFETIQAALDSVQNGDSVVVQHGRYVEALTAPVGSFALIGVIAQGENPDRPLIDPSELEGSTGLACLFLPNNSHVLIENWNFHNGAAMFPRDHLDQSACIRNFSSSLTVRGCRFDSTYKSLYPNSHQLIIEDCIFLNSIFGAITKITSAPATIRNCYFNVADRVLWLTDSATVENCTFRDQAGPGEWIWLTGRAMVVRGCQFGPSDTTTHAIIWSSQASGWLVENNVFEHLRVTGPALDFNGIGGDTSYFIGNTFRNIVAEAQVSGALEIQGPRVVVENNTFDRCVAFSPAGFGALAMYSNNSRVVNNRFIGPGINSPNVRMSSGRGTVVHGNSFEGTFSALTYTGTDTLNAENNWWGDNSGPYNWPLNPDGQGDWATGNVDFVPWILDTTTALDNARHIAPSIYSLAAFPNPFNSSVTIEFVASKAEHLALDIFDLTGRHVATVADEDFSLGIHRRIWNADEQASGIYFARLSAAGSGQRGWLEKLVLLK